MVRLRGAVGEALQVVEAVQRGGAAGEGGGVAFGHADAGQEGFQIVEGGRQQRRQLLQRGRIG